MASVNTSLRMIRNNVSMMGTHLIGPRHDLCEQPRNRETITEFDAIVAKGITSFPAGSSPGIDGFRPQYLKDAERALDVITKFCLPSSKTFRNYWIILHQFPGTINPFPKSATWGQTSNANIWRTEFIDAFGLVFCTYLPT
ncbi:hypothetical protein PPYR_06891 [Photinus pyralis]|uniref:Uncharacterized protein n=1 Tax=Photinus pyralis TaxID=7054 RepID=A0A5N4ANY2_PHOPY|nr:hypothetical protein PPYR_06891 [Photinus pyralis]